jgi:hypothetical protein
MYGEKFPIHGLLDYPPHYPQHLVAETQLIIAEGVKRFPTLDLILPFFQYVIAQMTPVLLREASGVRPDLALVRMGELVNDMLAEHFRNDDLRLGLRRDIVMSSEWLALAEAVAKKCEGPMPAQPREESSVPPAAAPALQVNNTAAVYLVSQPARRAKKRNRKPARPQEPAADKKGDGAGVGNSAPATGRTFTHSDDYSNVTLDGVNYSLTPNRQKQMRLLHEEHENGRPFVTKAKLLTATGGGSKVADTWRDSPLWGTFVVRGKRRGTYKLDLPPAKPAKKSNPSK